MKTLVNLKRISHFCLFNCEYYLLLFKATPTNNIRNWWRGSTFINKNGLPHEIIYQFELVPFRVSSAMIVFARWWNFAGKKSDLREFLLLNEPIHKSTRKTIGLNNILKMQGDSATSLFKNIFYVRLLPGLKWYIATCYSLILIDAFYEPLKKMWRGHKCLDR